MPVVLLAAAVVGLAPAGASAHRLEVTAAVEVGGGGAVVRVDAWYEYGDPVAATVTVSDPAGGEVARGTLPAATPDGLRLPLPRPGPGLYAVTVDDGAGHREVVPFALSADHPAVAEYRSARRNRWLMSAVGLAAIAAGTGLSRRLLARKHHPGGRGA